MNHIAPLHEPLIRKVPLFRLAPGLPRLEPGRAVQFQRLGYFAADPDGAFNRTVGLRDDWARIKARATTAAS